MNDVWIWLFMVAWLSITVGVAIVLSCWIASEKRRNRRIKKMVFSNDSWCNLNCRHFEECMSKCGEMDDVWDELEDYCVNCPMSKAIEVWETQEEIKRRGRQ